MSFKVKVKHIIIAFLPMVVVFLISRIFTYLDWFNIYFWLSPITHFVGGIVTAWTAYLLYTYLENKKLHISSDFLFYLFLIGVVAIFGVFWEFYEFLSDIYLATSYLGNVYDTLEDLSMDLFGAFIFVVYLAKFKGFNLTCGEV